VSHPRWWETGERSIADEQAWFVEDGLDFVLDEPLLRDREVVVFRGRLRLGERRVPASVVYPPSYAFGGHPAVVAPELPVDRHRTHEGTLCLDHPVFGESAPMCGAEAVTRAERLWHLWENDREQLEREEADAPDPKANYYDYGADSAVGFIDVDIAHGTGGYFTLNARSLAPLRAVMTGVRVTHPQPATIIPRIGLDALAGPLEVYGAWRRVDRAPPFTAAELRPWLDESHAALVRQQVRYAEGRAKADNRPDTPLVLAFVYPDEGPGRGQTHDAWLFIAIDPRDGSGHIARTFHLRTDERWLRQPQLRPLSETSVAIVGVGALGSQVADLLARAGVGKLTLVDYDYVTHGNRIRHELDLQDLGRTKVHAMAARLRAVNPWCDIDPLTYRLGGTGAPGEEPNLQQAEDLMVDRVRNSDLIINASAHPPTGSYISSIGAESSTPVLHTFVSAGAWGGRVLLQRPGVSGCWDCLALAQEHPDRYDAAGSVPDVASDPEVREVSERGCADPTFTGPGFELTAAAAAAARVAVQALIDSNGYPGVSFDLATLNFRDALTAAPAAQYTRLQPHPDCRTCRGA
jgi:hypothetical protein